MRGRRAVVGLCLLCAVACGALAVAPNAMALKGTTAFTCRPETKPTETTKGFEDEHCTKAVTGTKAIWVHEEIKPGTNTQVISSNTETQGKLVYPKLKSLIGGVEFELEAGGFQSCINKTSVENKENGAKQMEAAGEGCGEFYNVIVKKPAKCTVKNGTVSLPEKGEGKTVVKEVEGKSEMYGEALPPVATKVFAEFTFEGAECALKGTTVKVTGTARANVTTEEGKLDGPTVRLTTAETGKTLKVGAQKAEAEGTATVRMLPTIGQEENPIVVTTTAS
jgi:hypothetical protein